MNSEKIKALIKNEKNKLKILDRILNSDNRRINKKRIKQEKENIKEKIKSYQKLLKQFRKIPKLSASSLGNSKDRFAYKSSRKRKNKSFNTNF